VRPPDAILTVFLKELRELLRDRRSLMVMFGVPLVVYPLLFAGLGALTKGKVEEQRARLANVVVVNAGAAPELLRRLRLPEAKISISEETVADDKVRSGAVDAILVVPADAEKLLLTLIPATPPTGPPLAGASTRPAGPTFTIRFDRSRGNSDATESRLRQIISGYERWVVEQRLMQRQEPLELLAPLSRSSVDLATQDQRLGRFLSQLLPLLLLVTGMLGAFFPALNATTTERELGTLETLLVTPVSRTQLLIAKGVLVLLCSIVTAGLNMASMSLVLGNLAAGAREAFGTVAINPGAMALAFVATIPALVLFSAMVMCVGLVARNYREANSFAAPVMMIPMVAMAIGLVDPPTSNALLWTPVANTTVIIRDILTARLTIPNLVVASLANLLFAAVVVSISARLFTNEQLVNPSWEPLSLKGFFRKRSLDPSAPTRYPTIDAALLLVGAALLIQFYAGPHVGRLLVEKQIGIPIAVLVLQVASFILPGALFLTLGRFNQPKVLSLTAPNSPLAWPGSLLLGAGVALVAVYYQLLQHSATGLQPSDSAQGVAELLGAQLQNSLWLSVAVFAVLPGIAEEFLFRGIVLSAFRKRMSPHIAIWIVAVIFSAVHMDLAGFLTRTALGALLGYVVLWSGSLLPAMLLHAAYNGTQVVLLSKLDSSAAATRPAELLSPTSPYWLACLAIGLVLTLAAWPLLRRK
jgi:sodium transport system permease protein